MRRTIVLVALVGCGRDAPSPRAVDAARVVTVDAAPPPPDATAARPSPTTLDDALARLRADGLGDAADVISRRIAQARPKMRLTPQQGLTAATALLEHADTFRALHAVMPRSTVELARAVRERGVPLDDAAAIAAYLVRFVTVLDFERLAVFDENHSHVTGRDWPEIDYTGEGMTWQGQSAYWMPRGVVDFRKVEHIHAYFVGAEALPHWRRVYRPRGRVADVVI